LAFFLIDYACHDLKPDQGHSPSVGSFKKNQSGFILWCTYLYSVF